MAQYENQSTFEVARDGTFAMSPVTGSAFCLEPGPSNVGGFPLTLTINDGVTRQLVLRGPAWVDGPFSSATIKVEAGSGGGVWKDTWTLTLLPGLERRELPRPVTSRQGHLVVASPGMVLLFDLDSRRNAAAFKPMSPNDAEEFPAPVGDFFIYPGAPDRLSLEPADPASPNPSYQKAAVGRSEAWEVTQFSELTFAVELAFPGGLSGASAQQSEDVDMTAHLQWALRKDGPTEDEFQMGTALLMPARIPFPGLTASLRLGQLVDDAGDRYRRLRERYPFARFLLRVTRNALASTTFDSERPLLRCYAYGTY